MTPDNKQVVQLSKMGLTAVEIAESLGYEVTAVEFILATNPEIRRELEVVKPTDIGDVEKTELGFKDLEPSAMAVLKDILGDTSVKDSVRSDVARYVMDQRLGLKKPKQLTVNFNIGDFNERLKIVKARRAELAKAIDVPQIEVAA